MTIKQLLIKATSKLKQKNIQSPNLDTVVLLSHAFNKPKSYLFTYPEKKLTKTQINKFNKLLKRRLNHEPLAYITGHKEFYGFNFKVNKNVMIPRPETEMLIDEIQAIGNRQRAIVDIGTGSGCIAVTLAKKLPQTKILTTEISKPALKLAKQNAKRHGVFSKIKFYQGNLLEPVKNKKIDILVANLPYLSKKEYSQSPTSKELSYEPKVALTDAKNGLSLFEELFEQIDSFKPIKQSLKYIVLEIGYNQGKNIKKIAKQTYPKAKFEIKKDLCGFDRVIIIEK